MCCICGKTSPVGFVRALPDDGNFKCPGCLELIAEERKEMKAAVEAKRKEGLLAKIPAAFRHTEKSKLPFPAAMDRAARWQFGPKGLLLHGETGSGKSRIIWEIAKREILAGRNVRAVSSFELVRYPSLWMMGSDAASQFAQDLVTAEILLLDDVFKAKATERIEELLFAVIDERGMWERPCLVTLNDTGETLKERLSTDRGPALVRRLKDYCTSINIAEPIYG
jgi:DNA replication protein DnaC